MSKGVAKLLHKFRGISWHLLGNPWHSLEWAERRLSSCVLCFCVFVIIRKLGKLVVLYRTVFTQYLPTYDPELVQEKRQQKCRVIVMISSRQYGSWSYWWRSDRHGLSFCTGWAVPRYVSYVLGVLAVGCGWLQSGKFSARYGHSK